jgi:CHAT domain-containing protein
VCAARSDDDDAAVRQAAVAYYDFVMAWSSTKYSLHTWLTRLQEVAGTSLRLVVWDDTDMGIPWELYRYVVGDQAVWLGASFQVTRWTTVHEAGRHDQFSAEAEPRLSGTGILCFEDAKLVPRKGGLSITTIAECHEMPTLGTLCRALDSAAQHYGLVYVRAHGKYGGDLTTTTLGGISLAKFQTLRLSAIHASGSVVLLNACNSARPVFDPAPGDAANRNFAEVFLRHRARAVVATMGEVPTGSSASLARKVIADARSGGVRLPELLRRRRADAARDLPPDTLDLTEEQEEAIRSFLYASLYVYFGHPDAVITLGEPS